VLGIFIVKLLWDTGFLRNTGKLRWQRFVERYTALANDYEKYLRTTEIVFVNLQ